MHIRDNSTALIAITNMRIGSGDTGNELPAGTPNKMSSAFEFSESIIPSAIPIRAPAPPNMSPCSMNEYKMEDERIPSVFSTAISCMRELTLIEREDKILKAATITMRQSIIVMLSFSMATERKKSPC